MAHPAFLCIGAQKAGTDWIHDQFAAHRDFWMPPIKELTFFTHGFKDNKRQKAERQLGWKMIKHGRGEADYTFDIAFLLRMIHGQADPENHDFRAYFALFEGMPGLSGDCTPSYCWLDDDMVRAIYAQMPQTRFVLLVRDPADRLWSQAQMHVRLGGKGAERLTTDLEAFATFAEGNSRRLSFLSTTIRRWRALDDGGRFAVFQFDDLKADPLAYRTAIATHIGADPRGFALDPGYNRKASQPGKRPMPDDFRAWMARYFAAEYRELADLMGGHATRWLAANEAILAG